jgi:Cu+-exporting ATPase
MIEPEIRIQIKCFHCGEDCPDERINQQEKYFCCDGCMLVYNLLDKNGMCEYYQITSNPGPSRRILIREGKFGFLDDEAVRSKLITFTDGRQTSVSFYLPQMHCSSCIWLLENLHRLEHSVISSRVDFPKKEVLLVFEEGDFSLRKAAELLTGIGYEPHISLKDIDEKKVKKIDRRRILRLGVAGFCFGNIMMLSFPEYFSAGSQIDAHLKLFFKYLNLCLAFPVFFYCSAEFYSSAWNGIKQKFLSIDAPIVLAIVITFGRSVYDIVTGLGSGYLDSMSGIVFFMLAGRVFQDYTHQSLSFERDYKSYFPISVTVTKDGMEKEIPVSSLSVGDRIIVRSGELIPADSILFLGKANIDYSFVTGESKPVEKIIGEIVYAGGRQFGGKIEMEVIKEVSQSYLTKLWNKDAFKEEGTKKKSFIHALSRNFTWGLLALAFLSSIYWAAVDSTRILNAVTSVLIVACPCALLLSATFTNGNILRIFGRNGLYLKNAEVIESLATVNTIVFDKTGTLTESGSSSLVFSGDLLTKEMSRAVNSLAGQSIHPLSRAIASNGPKYEVLPVLQFVDHPGKGLEGIVDGISVRLGSEDFVGGHNIKELRGSYVHLSVDNVYKGYFALKTPYRNSLFELMQSLKNKFGLVLLSGDNASERDYLQNLLGPESELRFDQGPDDKLEYVLALQGKGKRVIMIGDGLNDAGALKQSDVGIAVTDDINNFSPACDAILASTNFSRLDSLIEFARFGKVIILGSFIISILYNLVGLAFAVQGTLSPVIAAILMPISSVSILFFTTGMSSLAGKWFFRK